MAAIAYGIGCPAVVGDYIPEGTPRKLALGFASHTHCHGGMRSFNVTGLFSRLGVVPVLLGTVLTLAGCDARPPNASVSPVGRPDAKPGGESQNLKQRQIAFLNRLREADPQGRTIDRALLNEQNELGLVLDRTVEMEKIPPLMKTMLTQMAREFPGEDLTVIAYAPSDPPRKIGTARLDTRTRDMTYTPAR